MALKQFEIYGHLLFYEQLFYLLVKVQVHLSIDLKPFCHHINVPYLFYNFVDR